MSSVGETLRGERLRKNLGLEQISRETKISSRLLEAIEHDRFDQLPGGVFAKSFVRQYARFLGLDDEEMAAEVERTLHSETDLPGFAAALPEPAYKVPKMTEWDGSARRTSSTLPSLAAVVAVMLVCSGIYAWWQRHPATPPAAPPAARSAQPVAETSAPPGAPQPSAAAPAQEPSAAVPPDQTGAPGPEGTPEGAPENAIGNATLHVSLTADQPTWVRAWADGKQVMTATLEPNAIKTVEAAGEIRLRTGNAGSLQITLNGKPLGPVGPKGQVRIVQMTPQGVQILLPPKPAAPEPAPPDPL